MKHEALREARGKLLLYEVEKNEELLESSRNDTDEIIAIKYQDTTIAINPTWQSDIDPIKIVMIELVLSTKLFYKMFQSRTE